MSRTKEEIKASIKDRVFQDCLTMQSSYEVFSDICKFTVQTLPFGSAGNPEKLASELESLGIRYENRSFGGIKALYTSCGEVILDCDGTARYRNADVGSLLNRDATAIHSFLTELESIYASVFELVDEYEARRIEFTSILKKFTDVKPVLKQRANKKDWKAFIASNMEKAKKKLNALEVIDSQTVDIKVAEAKKRLLKEVEKEYVMYVEKQHASELKKMYPSFVEKVNESLAGFEYTIKKCKPMRAEHYEEYRLQLPYGVLAFRLYKTRYDENLPLHISEMIPLAKRISESLGICPTAARISKIQDHELAEEFINLQKKSKNAFYFLNEKKSQER